MDGFYDTSAGQNSDTVYELFVCRGDFFLQWKRAMELDAAKLAENGGSMWHFFFLYSYLIHSITAQQFEYRYRFYMNSSTYTTNNSFSSNLNASLFSLYANATHKDGLYTTTAGQNLILYGLFLCRHLP